MVSFAKGWRPAGIFGRIKYHRQDAGATKARDRQHVRAAKHVISSTFGGYPFAGRPAGLFALPHISRRLWHALGTRSQPPPKGNRPASRTFFACQS